MRRTSSTGIECGGLEGNFERKTATAIVYYNVVDRPTNVSRFRNARGMHVPAAHAVSRFRTVPTGGSTSETAGANTIIKMGNILGGMPVDDLYETDNYSRTEFGCRRSIDRVSPDVVIKRAWEWTREKWSALTRGIIRRDTRVSWPPERRPPPPLPEDDRPACDCCTCTYAHADVQSHVCRPADVQSKLPYRFVRDFGGTT